MLFSRTPPTDMKIIKFKIGNSAIFFSTGGAYSDIEFTSGKLSVPSPSPLIS